LGDSQNVGKKNHKTEDSAGLKEFLKHSASKGFSHFTKPVKIVWHAIRNINRQTAKK
jgi:hypothetical protein